MPGEGEVDRFEVAYSAGVAEQMRPPAEPGPRRSSADGGPLGAAAPSEGFALAGCVLTPTRGIERGYVVIEGDEIAEVTERRPQSVRVHETKGVIAPGLIDLHGHPEFNVFAAWEPPKQFINRYAWRDSDLYQALVRDPQNHLLDVLPAWTQLHYSEVRALVGGVTAIQGTGGQARSYSEEALVRNVDKWIFGGQVGRSMIDLPSGSRGMDDLQSILAGIEAGAVKAFYVHLAEGRSDNQRSRDEFERLVGLDALTASTVVIHGTALSEDQLADLADAEAKLVWSPQSNLRLYGETTKAGAALARDVTVGLGADWLPSGSTSLLAEVKVARRCLADEGHEVSPKRLVDMLTRDAAKAAGLADKLGSLAKGRPADLVVFERRAADPWANVVDAEPASVELVMIDGDLTYGRADWISELAASPDESQLEPLIAWGKRMLLDTSHMVNPNGEQAPTLGQLRTDLVREFPQVGPIFA
ncbi:MAG: amidohydrolase family protein [Solirubrobacterales bacterium]|nr:amidohydrolase family protein [Solirubrobacterales bacterium]